MQKIPKKYVDASVIGFELAGSIAVSVLIGHWLDGQFDSKPILTIIFFFFGLAAGFRALYRFYKKTLASMEKNSDEI